MSIELSRLAGFGRHLRGRGFPVSTTRVLTFCRAATLLQPLSPDDLYWAARSTLASDPRRFEAFDSAFLEYFSGSEHGEGIQGIERPQFGSSAGADNLPNSINLDRAERIFRIVESAELATDEAETGLIASDLEILRHKNFEDLSDEERARALGLIRRLSLDVPKRRSRRLRSARRGHRLDLRRTLRYSLATHGEPFRRARRGRRIKARSLVLLLDVSGSMTSYSSALLQFGFAAMAAGHRVEVFCFGTHLTRVTRALRTRNPDQALKEIAKLVNDWDGGTRIGDSIHELSRRFGQHGFFRGSVVILCSDGLERGDPAQLSAEMAKLKRLAHRVVWVNPLKGSPAYQPLARGMASALPHIDVFIPGHNLASLEALGEVLSD